MAHADHVLKDGRAVGYSSGTIYSSTSRRRGSPPKSPSVGATMTEPIKEIRATVARFPYLAEGRNSDLDVAVPPRR